MCAHKSSALIDLGLWSAPLFADMRSCYFYDPSIEVSPGFEVDNGGKAFFSNSKHRKVVYFRFFGDGMDDNGHGTHVTASIAGSTIQGYLKHQNFSVVYSGGCALGRYFYLSLLTLSLCAQVPGVITMEWPLEQNWHSPILAGLRLVAMVELVFRGILGRITSRTHGALEPGYLASPGAVIRQHTMVLHKVPGSNLPLGALAYDKYCMWE